MHRLSSLGQPWYRADESGALDSTSLSLLQHQQLLLQGQAYGQMVSSVTEVALKYLPEQVGDILVVAPSQAYALVGMVRSFHCAPV